MGSTWTSLKFCHVAESKVVPDASWDSACLSGKSWTLNLGASSSSPTGCTGFFDGECPEAKHFRAQVEGTG